MFNYHKTELFLIFILKYDLSSIGIDIFVKLINSIIVLNQWCWVYHTPQSCFIKDQVESWLWFDNAGCNWLASHITYLSVSSLNSWHLYLGEHSWFCGLLLSKMLDHMGNESDSPVFWLKIENLLYVN